MVPLNQPFYLYLFWINVWDLLLTIFMSWNIFLFGLFVMQLGPVKNGMFTQYWPRHSRWYKTSNGDLRSYFTISTSVDIWRHTATVVTVRFKGRGLLPLSFRYYLSFHLTTTQGFCLKIKAYNNFCNVRTARTQESSKRTLSVAVKQPCEPRMHLGLNMPSPAMTVHWRVGFD